MRRVLSRKAEIPFRYALSRLRGRHWQSMLREQPRLIASEGEIEQLGANRAR
jgi:hypothetical protein